MEKRIDNLSHVTEDIYSQQNRKQALTFTKSDTYSIHQQENTANRPHSQEYSHTELKPQAAKHRRGERYKSNVRRNNWVHVDQQDGNIGPLGGDIPTSPSSYSSSRVASSLSPYGTTHHKLSISTSLTPPTSPMGQEPWLSLPTAEHQSMEQHLFSGTASSMAYQTRSQPEPSIILEDSTAPIIMRSSAARKKSSPISKIAILRRKSVSELTKHSTKSKLLTRKISYGGQPLSQELSFSTPKSKLNHSWNY